MATSESDSEVDFESADEGEPVTFHDKPKSSKFTGKNENSPAETIKVANDEDSKLEIPKTVQSNISSETLNKTVDCKVLKEESLLENDNEVKLSGQSVSLNDSKPKPSDNEPNEFDSKVPKEKPVKLNQESKSTAKDKEDRVKAVKNVKPASSIEESKSTAKNEEDRVKVVTNVKPARLIEESKSTAKDEEDQVKMVSNVKPTRSIEESKSRAKSEEKPDKIMKNVTRKLSNPEKTTRVMLHMEKKALEKSGSKKSPQNVLTENELSVLERLGTPKEEKKTPSPGWGLGNWGTSFISSAASSVSTFTSHVTQGIETVLETVEASLGAPSPEELATNLSKKEEVESDPKIVPQKQDSSDSVSPKNHEAHEGLLSSGLMGGVSALTRALESTGSKVITGGLDTLELIGKKTMDILTEGDPGLRNKRNIFAGDKTTLSQVLREARDKIENSSIDQSFEDPFPIHYSKLFDEFQGLVHLEALEMLSTQSKTKLETLVSDPMNESCDELVAVMEKIRTVCEDLPPTDDTPDEEVSQDFNKLLAEHVSSLPFKLNVEKIENIPNEAKEWLRDCKDKQERREVVDAKEIYIKAISILAKMSACMMEVYHKIAELLLVNGPPLKELYDHSKHLTSLTSVLCLEIVILTSEFCRCLNTAADDSEDPDAVNPLITNVYLEASNSSMYIQDAFRLLILVLQEIASTVI